MFRIPDSKNRITGSGYSHGELVVAIGARVSRKTMNSIGRGPAYQDSGKFIIARQQ